MVWDGTSHIGSVVYYWCEEGYRTRSSANSSTCGENGLWEEVDLRCEGADVGWRMSYSSENVWWQFAQICI